MSDRKRQNRYARTGSSRAEKFANGEPDLPAVIPEAPRIQVISVPNGNRVPLYRPNPNHTLRDRLGAGGLRRDNVIGAAVTEAATQYNIAETGFERSQRELDKERLRGSLIVPEIMAEQLSVMETVTNGKIAVKKALGRLAEVDAELARERHLNELDFQIEATNRQNELGEAQAKRAHIEELTARSVDGALARSEAELWRSRAEAELYQRRIRDLRAPAKDEPTPTAPSDNPVDELLRRNLETEVRVVGMRKETKAAVAAIEAGARAEGRELTPDEIELIDALRNAEAASESDARRGGASDLR